MVLVFLFNLFFCPIWQPDAGRDQSCPTLRIALKGTGEHSGWSACGKLRRTRSRRDVSALHYVVRQERARDCSKSVSRERSTILYARAHTHTGTGTHAHTTHKHQAVRPGNPARAQHSGCCCCSSYCVIFTHKHTHTYYIYICIPHACLIRGSKLEPKSSPGETMSS